MKVMSPASPWWGTGVRKAQGQDSRQADPVLACALQRWICRTPARLARRSARQPGPGSRDRPVGAVTKCPAWF